MFQRRNPFSSYRGPFEASTADPLKIFKATRSVPGSDPGFSNGLPQPLAPGGAGFPAVLGNPQAGIPQLSVKIDELPKHQYIPESAQSVDIRRADLIVAGGQSTLILFTCPQGASVRFIGYAVYSDATDFNTINFLPTVNGQRIFPFHGDPQNNYKIGLGVAPDLGNEAMIPCQLRLKPGDVLQWIGFNNALVGVRLGVRMSGYVDTSQVNKDDRFGG